MILNGQILWSRSNFNPGSGQVVQAVYTVYAGVQYLKSYSMRSGVLAWRSSRSRFQPFTNLSDSAPRRLVRPSYKLVSCVLFRRGQSHPRGRIRLSKGTEREPQSQGKLPLRPVLRRDLPVLSKPATSLAAAIVRVRRIVHRHRSN